MFIIIVLHFALKIKIQENISTLTNLSLKRRFSVIQVNKLKIEAKYFFFRIRKNIKTKMQVKYVLNVHIYLLVENKNIIN